MKKYMSIALIIASTFVCGCDESVSGETEQATLLAEPVSPILKEAEDRTQFQADYSNRAGWWKPLVSKAEQLYIAFNAVGVPSLDCTEGSRHRLVLASKSSSEAWQYSFAHTANGKAYWTGCDDVGHRQPTIAVDGNRRVHIWAGMHANKDGCCYFRKDSAQSKLLLNKSFPTTGYFTYPVASSGPSGDIHLIIRNLPNVLSEEPGLKYESSGEHYYWDNTISRWFELEPFASNTMTNNGRNILVYPDDIHVSDDGIVHILWEWAFDKTSAKRYMGSYMQYDPSLETYYTAAGMQVDSTVNIDSYTSYPEIAYETSTPYRDANSYVQTAKIIYNGNYCAPCVIFRKTTNNRDFGLYLTRWLDDDWAQAETIYEGTDNTFATIDGFAKDNQITVYFAKKGVGVIRARRGFEDNGWEEKNIIPTDAVDIRLAVETTEDQATALYVTEVKSSDEEAALSIIFSDE